jgi:hypothetical protein
MAATLDGWTETAADTNGGGVTATHAAETGKTFIVTGIDYSGDAAALITVESPSSTVLWRMRYAAAFADGRVFPPGVLKGASGQAVLVRISAGTTNTEANISGYSIKQ